LVECTEGALPNAESCRRLLPSKGLRPLFRTAVAVVLLGLAVALALPALHLSSADTGALVGRWWPVVPAAAGIAGLVNRRRFYGPAFPMVVALLGLAFLAGHLLALPVGPLLLAAILLALGLRLVAGAGTWGRAGRRPWLNLGRFGLPPRNWRVAGEVRLGGPDWRVENSSTYLWVGELHLDLTNTRLPEGTTPVRIGMFAGEVEIIVPADIGVRAGSNMFAGEINILGHNSSGISPHLSVESEDYRACPRRVDIEVEMWFGELNIRRRG